MLGIFGGSGLYGLGKKSSEEEVITPYGYALVYRYKIGKKEVIFIPRHGKSHSLAPHKINYRANVYALKKLGISVGFATYACGIISKYKPGDLILLDDFIGIERAITFFDDFSSGIKHFDFSNPYDKKLSSKVKEAATIHRIKLKNGGIVKTTPGPRFESKAEIKMYGKMGANLVSMTNCYETILMREMEIPFSGLGIGTNYACGISKKPLNHEEVLELMGKKKGMVNLIIKKLVKFID